MKRKIAAILAADVAEYSRLVAEDEEQTVRQLVASIEVFKLSIENHGGRIFNTAGDAVLAEFQSAVEAVRSAIDIQETLCARSEAHAPNRRLMFRMGISIGDVVENGGDLLGDGVNVAARLQSLSQPGGLAISRWVQEQVAGKVPREFRDTGYRLVKNMPAPIHVFQSGPTAAAAPAAEPKVRRAARKAARPRVRWTISPEITARMRGVGFLVVGVGLLAGIIGLFVSNLPALGPAAIGQAPPTSATLKTPAPKPATAERSPAPPIVTPQPRPAFQSPEQSLAAKEEEAAAPGAAPAGAASPPSPALSPSAPALRPSPPAQAATPPAGNSGNAGPAQPRRSPETFIAPESFVPPESLVPPAPSATQDRAARQQKKRCAEVLERAQLGDLSSDDRAFLRSNCR